MPRQRTLEALQELNFTDAMVVACARHGSHVAQSAGQPELSVEVFPAVVAEQKGAARLTLPLRVDESPTARRTGVSFGNR